MRLLSALAVCVSASFSFPAPARILQQNVDVYLFWLEGCPHCEEQIRYVSSVEARDGAVRVHYLELGPAQNRRLYVEAARALRLREAAVPLTIVGNTAVIGSMPGLDAGPLLEDLITECRQTSCADVIGPIARELSAVANRTLAIRQLEAAPEESRQPAESTDAGKRITLPLIGDVNLQALSLPVLTVVLAAVDGFNPCAMWVLVFLIGLLLGLQDRVRRWLLGGAFLLTTAVVYYLVIAAWLSALLIIGVISWLRVGIGVLALAGGAYYIWEFVHNPGLICQVAGESRRRRVMAGLRAATTEPRFFVAVAAIVALAVGVNFVELLCSAGIPAVYTQILALTPMPGWQHYGWLGLYVLVFLLDDVLVFIVAMVTLELTGVTARYAHYAQLVGGMVLIAVGMLLILRPGWLAFG